MPKYRVPIDVQKKKHYIWGCTYYTYKLYSDDDEAKHTQIKFVDIDGFIIGFHKPEEFLNVYVKAVRSAKISTAKAAEATKTAAVQIAGGARDLAKETAKKTNTLFGRIKDKLASKKDNSITSQDIHEDEPNKDSQG